MLNSQTLSRGNSSGYLSFIILAFALSFFFIACKKLNPSERNYLVELEHNDSIIYWNSPLSSGFVKYELYETQHPIESIEDLEPNSFIFGTSDYLQHVFPYKTRKVSNGAYYTLLVKLKDRQVLSKSKYIASNKIFIRGSLSKVYDLPSKNVFVIATKENSESFVIFDYKQNKIISQGDLPVNLLSENYKTIGIYNNEIGYFYLNIFTKIVNFYSLSTSKTNYIPLDTNAVVMNPIEVVGNHMYCNSAFNGLSSFDLSVPYSSPAYFGMARLPFYISSNGKTAFSTSPNLVVRHLINADGSFVYNDQSHISYQNIHPEIFTVSPSAKFFIPNKDGQIFDNKYNITGKLNSSWDAQNIHYAFNEQEDMVFSLVKSSKPYVSSQKLNDLNKVKRYYLDAQTSLSPAALWHKNETLYVFYNSNFFGPQYTVVQSIVNPTNE